MTTPTLHALVAAARRQLAEAGIPPAEAELDARLLMERLLGWDAARFFAHGNEPAASGVVERYEAVIRRRSAREPVAYIAGSQEFWGVPFEVTPAVLIPRPETELIVEISLELHPDPAAPLRVADICTGSGCLAVAIATERPAATVVAADLSPEALAVAARNVARHNLGDRVSTRQADLLDGLDGPFDLIVANPPYVPAGDAATMQPEVIAHEPSFALFSGPDGLDAIRRLIRQAGVHLATQGHLVFEFGFGQRDPITTLLDTVADLALVAMRSDLQGIPRTAIARKR